MRHGAPLVVVSFSNNFFPAFTTINKGPDPEKSDIKGKMVVASLNAQSDPQTALVCVCVGRKEQRFLYFFYSPVCAPKPDAATYDLHV